MLPGSISPPSLFHLIQHLASVNIWLGCILLSYAVFLVSAKALHYSYILCKWEWDSGSLIKWLGYGPDHRGIAVQFTAGSEAFPFSTASGLALGPRNYVSNWKRGLLVEGWSSWKWLLTCAHCSSN